MSVSRGNETCIVKETHSHTTPSPTSTRRRATPHTTETETSDVLSTAALIPMVSGPPPSIYQPKALWRALRGWLRAATATRASYALPGP